MPTSPRYYDLLEAMPLAGCPLCRVILNDRDRYLDSLLYEYVNTYEVNQAFRDSRGFCQPHMVLLQSQTGNALGIAILNHAVIDELLKLTETPPTRNGLSRLLGREQTQSVRLQPTTDCLICARIDETERSYIDVIRPVAATDKLWKAFKDSPGGFCLPHYRTLIDQISEAELLARIQREHWHALYSELTQFLEKYNQSNTHEGFGPERDSWRRALRLISGGIIKNTNSKQNQNDL